MRSSSNHSRGEVAPVPRSLKGEVATTLTLFSLLLMLVGTIAGTHETVSTNVKQLFTRAQQPQCSYHTDAVVYKDSVGNRRLAREEMRGSWGVSNNKQDQLAPSNLFGSESVFPFHTESLKLKPDPRGTYENGEQASVRLFGASESGEWEITDRFCTTRSGSSGCPQNPDSNPDVNVIDGFRVGCGVDIEYGWVVRRKSGQPAPTVQPTAIPTTRPTILPSPFPSATPPASCRLNTASCHARNVRIGKVDRNQVRIEWDAPQNCSSFRPGISEYWVDVIDITDRTFVCAKTALDTSTTCRPSRDKQRTITKNMVEWNSAHRYIASIHTYNGIPGCVGGPANSAPFSYIPPTAIPTITPLPTRIPTLRPTARPTIRPTTRPTIRPTTRPSTVPTRTPTERPTPTPTQSVRDLTCIHEKLSGSKKILIAPLNRNIPFDEYYALAQKIVTSTSQTNLSKENIYSKLQFDILNPLKYDELPLCTPQGEDDVSCTNAALLKAKLTCGAQHIVLIHSLGGFRSLAVLSKDSPELNFALFSRDFGPNTGPHELGHLIADLSDEYVETDPLYIRKPNSEINCTAQGTRDPATVCPAWSRDFPKSRFSDMGCFPGCTDNAHFRPTDNSIMNNSYESNIFNPPSIQGWKDALGTRTQTQSFDRKKKNSPIAIIELTKDAAGNITIGEPTLIHSPQHSLPEVPLSPETDTTLTLTNTAGQTIFERPIRFTYNYHEEEFTPAGIKTTQYEERQTDKIAIAIPLDATSYQLTIKKNDITIQSLPLQSLYLQSKNEMLLFDVNGDGVVNALDYALISKKYAYDGGGSKEDINTDNIINALDLSLIIHNFGRRIDE